MPEAQLEDFGSGLAPVTDGWFVVNVRDAEWWFAESRGARCAFENEYGDPPVEFAQFGINLTVLDPGQTVLYHAEENQEAFLVVSGECALLVDDDERHLRRWDFFHSAPWTAHAFVGAGEGPCVIVMVGSRSGPGVHYPVSELAARHGASVAEETSDWRQAYATVEAFRARAAAELGSSALGVAFARAPPDSALCDRSAVDAESSDWSLRVFDHVEVHATDFSESVRFYETVLAPLGIPRLADGTDWAGFANFNVVDRQPPSANVHLCFHARSREQVDGFHQVGVDAGFRTNGEPGYRDYAPGYYAAFLLDPDGNNVEALYRDEGNIGHGIGPHLR